MMRSVTACSAGGQQGAVLASFAAGLSMREIVRDRDGRVLLSANRDGSVEPAAAATVVLLRRPAHGGVPDRSGKRGPAAARTAQSGAGGPWCRRADLGRLAVVRSQWRRVARSS